MNKEISELRAWILHHASLLTDVKTEDEFLNRLEVLIRARFILKEKVT